MGKIHVKHGATWKEPTKLYVKRSGAWVEPSGGYIKAGGVWEKFYPGIDPALTLDLDFTITTTLDPRITFSRTSLGTYFDSAGVLKYAAHNLVRPSEDFDTTWLKGSGATVTVDAATAPNSTTTADKLNHVTAGTVQGGYVNQVVADPPYRAIFSLYAKAGSKNWLGLGGSTSTTGTAWFNLAAGTVGTRGANLVSSGIESVGNGWYRCWIVLATFAAGSAYIRVAEVDASLTCTSPGDIFIWGGQVEYVTTATTPSTYLPTTTAAVHGPRFDYDPVTHQPKGLLIEEARDNNIGYSTDLANFNWTKTGLTLTANSTTAPDGTTTGAKIVATASPATLSNITTANTYAASIFVKKDTADWVYLVGQVTDSPIAWFNIATGIVGTVQAGITNAQIQAIGNGWYRCIILDVGASGAEQLRLGLCDGDNSTTVTAGKSAYAWGPQVETFTTGALVATSYIPTGSSGAVTRAADIAVMTGSNFSSWYNQSAGTFVAELRPLDNAAAHALLIVDVGSSTNSIRLVGTVTPATVFTMTTAGVNQFTMTFAALTTNMPHKLGLSFALNDFAGCIDGGSVLTDVGGTLPAPTQMRLGTDGTTYLSGHIRRIRFFNVAKSDAELQALTT